MFLYFVCILANIYFIVYIYIYIYKSFEEHNRVMVRGKKVNIMRSEFLKGLDF